MISAFAVYVRPSASTRNGGGDRLTEVTAAATSSVPNRSAWARISAIRSGPMMPFRNPGKFSTSVVVVSWPPASRPSNSSGFKLARAV